MQRRIRTQPQEGQQPGIQYSYQVVFGSRSASAVIAAMTASGARANTSAAERALGSSPPPPRPRDLGEASPRKARMRAPSHRGRSRNLNRGFLKVSRGAERARDGRHAHRTGMKETGMYHRDWTRRPGFVPSRGDQQPILRLYQPAEGIGPQAPKQWASRDQAIHHAAQRPPSPLHASSPSAAESAYLCIQGLGTS